MKKVSLFFLLIGLVATLPLALAADIPYLSGRVNDHAGILSEHTRTDLSEKLRAHEERTTNQVVILTMASLEGESIEDYSNRVFNDWKLGQADTDNGILILVVPDERQMRIEVGYGLEGVLPDILAGRIIREIMTPRFREGDFDAGIMEGALAVLDVLEGQELPGTGEFDGASDSPDFSNFSGLENPDMSWPMRILIGAFIFGIIGMFTIVGLVMPGFGWFLYLFLIPFWATFPIMVVGTRATLIIFIVYLIGYPIVKLYLRTTPWFKKAKKDLSTKGKASIGGFTFSSGSSGSSWSSGSSSSSGGFSGGGGSSGGGGASGGW